MQKTENRQTFLDRLKGHFSQIDIDLIEFAYDLAKEAHRPQKRDCGERYFEHPRALCLILMDELGLYDRDMIIALLLHDIGEDTAILGSIGKGYNNFLKTADFRLSRIFGRVVSRLVVKLTKPKVDRTRFIKKKDAFSFYIENLEKDPKAMFLKMIDRLHNLRTSMASDFMDIEKSKRVLKETVHVYLPLFKKVKMPKRDKVIQEIEKECRRLKRATRYDKVEELRVAHNRKWDEISELCEPWH